MRYHSRMILRLLLALLLALPVGVSAGQHQHCEPAAATTADSGTSTQHHTSGKGQHASHELQASGDCNGCDLACKLACAAVALPLTAAPAASLPPGRVASGNIVAGPLNPHPLPLLRPPAHTPA